MVKKSWLFGGLFLVLVLLVGLVGYCGYSLATGEEVRVGSNVISIGTVDAAGAADYTCDGVNDDVQFQQALNALPAGGGTLQVYIGNYIFGANVTRAIANVTVQGLGRGSYIAWNGVNAVFTAGGNNWVFSDLRTDTGSITMGATTGWIWRNVTINATYYTLRTSADGNVTTGAITDSGLTAGRVTYAGASGLLLDEAGFEYNAITDRLTVKYITADNLQVLDVGLYGIVGVEWNKDTDTWRNIDDVGSTITPTAASFNSNPVWGNIKRCTLTATGVPTYGANARGDGLDLTGASGRVMVEIPKFWVKSANPSANVYRWWISPIDQLGFTIFPAFYQRSGIAKEHIYVSAYDADFEYNGANAAYNAANEQLQSRTGKQPYTGGANCIWSIPIDDLGAEPAVGNLCSTPTDGSFYIVDYLKTAGAWGGGGAGDTATIWLRKPGDATCGMANGEVLTNDTAVATIGNTTAGSTGRSVTIDHTRTLAGNIGAQWGIMNIWSLSAIQLLFYTEYAGANSQTLVGKGITDKPGGTGFNGEISGFNTSDTNIAVNGTGTGIGVNGLTPIVYRGIENLWGNVWQFIDGFIAVDAAYQIIKRSGTGVFATPMTVGNYESSVTVPIADAANDGYISNIVYEDLLAYSFVPGSVAGGSSSQYLCDYSYAHRTGNTNILRAGGNWDNGANAGVGYRNAGSVAGYANTFVGARLEFIGP
jgi:hypothetical protein